MQKQLIEKLDNVISLLDMFFKRDFTQRKKDSKEISEFMNKIKNYYEKINFLIKECETKILLMGKSFKNHIIQDLKNKKSEIEKLLN